MTMPISIRTEWVERLRSGNYIQNKSGNLHIIDGKEHGYCCLGVLSEIANEHGVVGCYALRKGLGNWMIAKYDGSESYLPSSVEEWSGVGFLDQRRLASMNDDKFDFNEIAEYIEEHL